MIRTRLTLRRALVSAGLITSSAIAQTSTLNSYSTGAATNFAAPALPNQWSPANPGTGSSTADVRIRWMPNGFGHTVNNDTGGVFNVNTLRVQSLTGGTTSLGTTGLAAFNFTGTDPQIIIEGWGSIMGATSPVSFSPGNISTATGDLTIRGTAHGDLSFNGIGGLNTRTIMAGNSGLLNSQIVNYSVASASGANTNTVVLNSGNLRLGPSTTLSVGLGGVAAIEANGGRLNVNTAGTAAGPAFMTASVTLNSTLVQTGGNISTAGITGFPNSNTAGQYLAYTASLTGPGGYTLSPTMGGSTVALRALNDYTGATTLAFPSQFGTTGLTLPGSVTLPAVLAVDGVNGGAGARLSATSGLNVRDGNLLVVNNGATAANRINDAADLTLHGGGAFFTTGASAYTETMGRLNASSGTGTLTAGNASTTATINGANIGVAFSVLSRSAGEGVLFIRGGASGSTATSGGLGTSATTSRVTFASAPSTALYSGAPNIGGGATPSVPVLPSVIGGAIASETGATTTNGTSFTFGLTTYGANGVRLLAAAEYDTVTAGGAATLGASYGNLRLNQSAASTHTVAAGGTTLNSLFVNPASGAATIGVSGGTDALTFPADAANLIVINQSQSTTFNAPVSFGGEGIIYAANNATQTSGPNFNGVISGTAGLTVSGPGGINLGASNTNSGALSIQGARVGFTSAASLSSFSGIVAGGSASAATSGGANGSTPTATRPRLQFNAPAAGSSVTLSQPVTLKSGLLEVLNGQLSTSNNATIELSGPVSGEGGFMVNLGAASVTGSALRLSGTGSTYSGQTRIQSGTLAITGDSVLGNSPTVDIASTAAIGGLRLDGNWTTTRLVNLSSAGSINTNGFNAVLNGPVSSSGAVTTDTFTKLGTGTLTLNGVNPLHMNISVSAGRLDVNGTVSPSGSVTVLSGATLGGSGTILKGITTSAGGTISPGTSPGTLTVGGSMTFNSSGATYSNLDIEIASSTSYDQIRLFGADTNFSMGTNPSLAVNATSNVQLNATSTGSLLQGDIIWLVINDAPVSGTNDGTLSGIFRNAGGLIPDDVADLVDLGNGYKAAISYNADFDTLNPRAADNTTLGNDIALIITTVPEPATVSCAGLTALALLRRRRR